MFPDPITPKSYPDLLQKVDYDPFGLMPVQFPARPRVFTTAARIARAKARLAAGQPVDRECYQRLLAATGIDQPLPTEGAITNDSTGPLQAAALRCGLAFHLNDESRYRARAIDTLRLLAPVYRARTWAGYEHQVIIRFAAVYDLVADGLDAADDELITDTLRWLVPQMDNQPHRYCNNHNTHDATARLAVGAALADRQMIHDGQYGLERGGKWRYGLIHSLRHDMLADGMQWEGTMSYHMVVMFALCESATILENLGVDVWRRRLPNLMQSDGHDEHRCWGPKGFKCLRDGFDAFLYQMMPGGDYSNLHDQILGNFRGAWVWWPLFAKAWEVYGDPRYAWALGFMNRGYPSSDGAVSPVWLRGLGDGDIEFIRLEERDIPAGEHPLARNATISIVGRHEHGSSLFPDHGSAVLRSHPTDDKAPAAYLYFGRHVAGHRSPAALHLEVHAHGRRITHAPHLYDLGYDEPKHLTWVRTTIAHNTMVVDQASMFPYDFATESVFEYEIWRDKVSDSELIAFQPGAVRSGSGSGIFPGAGGGGTFHAVRVANDNVYDGVRLDRALVLTPEYLLDVYQVTAVAPRELDWAVHVHGQVDRPAGAQACDLGQHRGYQHLTGGWSLPLPMCGLQLPWRMDNLPVGLRLAARVEEGAGVQLVVADDPPTDQRTPIGDLSKPQPRRAVLMRTRSASAVFAALWTFTADPTEMRWIAAAAGGFVEIEVASGTSRERWSVPRIDATSCRRMMD